MSDITGLDAVYLERNQCVALIARMAVAMGLSVAVTKTAIEGWDEAWHNCIYVGLPTGQVSWHFHDKEAYLFEGLPRGDVKWDEHSTPEKYLRVNGAFQLRKGEIETGGRKPDPTYEVMPEEEFLARNMEL